ncbi:MAG: hypothetical protein JWP81_4910 [Ferruginibacter sp.]|nr:hypothetical protein [Ferruginibacter sp.]
MSRQSKLFAADFYFNHSEDQFSAARSNTFLAANSLYLLHENFDGMPRQYLPKSACRRNTKG